MHSTRRRFLAATGTAFGGLLLSGCLTSGSATRNPDGRFGPLRTDPEGILDLPEGFSYRIVSRAGQVMDDGESVPDAADGMGCFDIGNGEIALVRNHEITPSGDNAVAVSPAYDTVARSLLALPGGTTTLVLDARTLELKRQYRSLAGTIRNCAGGVTPWNSWLSCEENTARATGRINKDHGYVFEVPATHRGLIDPQPLRAMGRFNHEAACVDPATGVVYMTEDRQDSLIYRFLPRERGNLAAGGTLQALALEGVSDTSNKADVQMQVGAPVQGTWFTLDDVEAPEDDLRTRGAAQGAAIFARGEGMWMGQGEFYFTATSGGVAGEGQIFRVRPMAGYEGADLVELFYESPAASEYSFGDNLVVSPFGDLIVCEDQYGAIVDNYLRGITPAGEAYAFGRLRIQTEPAGACFSPDGRTLFVNAYSPTMTLAITGPWPTA
ncbi:MAG: alkaline phosphatase PhoX [Alteraurantiacibacter sp.]